MNTSLLGPSPSPYRYGIDPPMIFSSLRTPPQHKTPGLSQSRPLDNASLFPLKSFKIASSHCSPFPEQVHPPVFGHEGRVAEPAGGGDYLHPPSSIPRTASVRCLPFRRRGGRGKGGDLAGNGPPAGHRPASARPGYLAFP